VDARWSGHHDGVCAHPKCIQNDRVVGWMVSRPTDILSGAYNQTFLGLEQSFLRRNGSTGLTGCQLLWLCL
jgi:hypothetical protein